MQGPRITADTIKDILRLKTDVMLSHEQIARSLRISKGAVGKYVGLARNAALDWPSARSMNGAELERRLLTRPARPSAYVLPDYGPIHLRLCGGSTLMRQWERYKADYSGQKTYRYTQFCEHYHGFVCGLSRSMRRVYRAGEGMFADFADYPVPLKDGGYAHIFMASMGASRYAFACVAAQETMHEWIRAAMQALHFYGGVPRLIVPDSSRGWIESCAAGDSDLVLGFSRHYGTTVLPSLSYDPQHRLQRESPMKTMERWIMRCLRQQQFGTAEQIERALQTLLEHLNHRQFGKLPGNRASAFAELDQPVLSSLPAQPYAFPLPARGEIPCLPFDGRSQARVLIVESDPATRAYLERLFGRKYQVSSIPEGQSALRAAREEPPDLVLGDATMPGFGGFDLLKALRADAATAPVSFILLSAGLDEKAYDEGMRAGADDCITKRFNARELLIRAEGMIALTKTRRETQRREAQLRAASLDILEGLNEAFMMVDSEWRISYINAAAECASGMPRACLLTRNYWDAFPAMRETIVDLEFHRAMSGCMSVQFEHYHAPRRIWVEMSASPIRNGGLLLRSHDITARKRAEEALQGVETRLSAELQAMSQLQTLSGRLLVASDFENALEEVLNAALTMLGAEMGIIQLYNPRLHALEIVTQRGFSDEFLAHFRSIKCDDNTASGRAAKYGKRVIVQDVRLDPAFAANRSLIASAAIRAWQSTPLFSRDGQLLGVLSTHFREPHYPFDRELRMLDLYGRQAVDLIERIRAEAVLCEHKELFKLVLNSITDCFMVVDADARFAHFNAAAKSMLAEQGISADELIGKQYLTEVFREASDDESGRAFRRAMSKRVPVEVENFFVPFKRWYLIRFFPMNKDGLAMVVQDITVRKRAEEALRESEARFRAMAEASPGLIWQVDPTGKSVYLNPRFRELLGKPLKDLLGTTWHSILHPDDMAGYVAALEKAVCQRGCLQHRVRIRRKDGEWRWLETSALPWFTSGGGYAGHIGISIDITEIVQAVNVK